MNHQRLGVPVAGLLAIVTASAAPPSVFVSDAWTRPTMAGMTAAGYMVIVNRGPTPDRLTGAASRIAARVSLHQSRMAGSVSVMRSVAAINVPPRGQAALAPGGFHLMLEGLKQPLRPGQHAPITLYFERMGPVRAQLAVRAGPSTMPGM